jgi:hypothetical protein
MVRVPIWIREGASRFEVSVQARSIRRAVDVAAALYPGAEVRVSFPIDAEAFFVDESGPRAEQLARERPDGVAA